MADGHAKTRVDNRELGKTEAYLEDDDRNNSMNDVECVEMDANKENIQRKAMATSNSSDNTCTFCNLQETDKTKDLRR